jgi:hypothetical protein
MSESTKYYHAKNCNQFIKSGGLQFSFEPYSHIGGCWNGIYSTDEINEQTALKELVDNPAVAVRELSREEFEQCAKKKEGINVSKSSQPSKRPRKTTGQQSLSQRVVQVVDDPNDTIQPPDPNPVIEKPEDALETGSVSTATPPPAV